MKTSTEGSPHLTRTFNCTLCHFDNTHRMVRDYMCQFYLSVHQSYRVLEADNAARAKSLAAWISRIRQEWPHVGIDAVEQGPTPTLPVLTHSGT